MSLPQCWVEVDLGAISRNHQRWAEALDFAGGLIVAVKKNAYGHGLVEVARTLEAMARPPALAIATVEEAERLRAAGVTARLIALSVMSGDLERALNSNIELTITDAADAGAVAAAALRTGREVVAHWKIDTGMTRLGRRPEEALASSSALRAMAGVRLASVYTHFSDAWNDHAWAHDQLRELLQFIESAGLDGAGPLIPIHIGGSDALTLRDELIQENRSAGRPIEVRVGIGLYGYHPGLAGLEPAMNFNARVIYRKRAPAGARVSYGGTHTLTRDSELALVGAGYGNGYPRALSNKGQVLIRGRRFPILGRVCMDQVVVDVTEAPEVEVGETATLFGRQGEAILGAEEMAGRSGTISYELLCLAGQINSRVYRRE